MFLLDVLADDVAGERNAVDELRMVPTTIGITDEVELVRYLRHPAAVCRRRLGL